mmetsp:Transcript_53236/g.116870  ORF Transcript_53236/g.116870 Transcript_53236/m.116870 type:complete len:133 (+) Transcript_53236:71-469(+)
MKIVAFSATVVSARLLHMASNSSEAGDIGEWASGDDYSESDVTVTVDHENIADACLQCLGSFAKKALPMSVCMGRKTEAGKFRAVAGNPGKIHTMYACICSKDWPYCSNLDPDQAHIDEATYNSAARPDPSL